MSVRVHIVDGPVGPAGGAHTEAGAGTGAVLTFLGVVRGLEDGCPLLAIDYETYEPMAPRELNRLANETTTRFGLLGLQLVHSRGVVPVGQPSLFIEIHSAHRREGLDAMDHLIEQLKRDVPIWKRPIFAAEPGVAADRGSDHA